jgi:hypothetical protein
MAKTQEIKMPINVKFLIFLHFQYKRMKMKRKTLLCIDRDNQVGYQGEKHPSQGARTIKMKYDEKDTTQKFNHRQVSCHSTDT